MDYYSEFIREANKIALVERREVLRRQMCEVDSDSPDFDRLIKEAVQITKILGDA